MQCLTDYFNFQLQYNTQTTPLLVISVTAVRNIFSRCLPLYFLLCCGWCQTKRIHQLKTSILYHSTSCDSYSCVVLSLLMLSITVIQMRSVWVWIAFIPQSLCCCCPLLFLWHYSNTRPVQIPQKLLSEDEMQNKAPNQQQQRP